MTRHRFGARLRAAMDAHGPLCAGLDPHRALRGAVGAARTTLAGLERFAMTCVEAFAGTRRRRSSRSRRSSRCSAPAGSRVLERVLADLRDAGTLTLLDVKRGDIGSTMQAYAEAYLGNGRRRCAPTR